MTLSLLQAGPNDTGSPDSSGKTDDVVVPIGPLHDLVGNVVSTATIPPGGTHTATFAITWHFPNLNREKVIGDAGSDPKNQINHNSLGRHYATKFKGASDVASFVSDNFKRLYSQTKLWHDTWYDSTLPYWLLDRTLLNISTLATSTAYRFADGRFYGYEGVEFGQGTPTHVWHYEQAMGRLFPEFDRLLRERVDFNPGVAFKPDGSIMFRGELDGYPSATDGQAGTILRAYRDHQTSPDDAFLKLNWPSIKLAMQWMIGQDGNADGIIECSQHNTQDAKWWGAVPWLSGLYLAALRACEEMAREMDDDTAGKNYRTIFEAGQKNFVGRLWDEEAQYFIQLPAAGHEHDVGSYQGCEADQAFGQHWAHQLGLGRIFPGDKTKAALASLWKNNFTPDAGVYRSHPENASGRWFAMAGEACLLICTFPRGKPAWLGGWPANYFNENWNGIEHQVAGHMIWEGLVQEGLAVERALHDRYHASKHNPWNEVEWGDHYARSMASYGVFTAICGFEYHGPKGTMAFAPRVTPEKFRAAFTGAEGWGTFAQEQRGDRLHASVELKWGKLGLKSLALTPPKTARNGNVAAILNGKPLSIQARVEGGRVVIDFNEKLDLAAGQKLELTVG
jgi:non-lysosomal glucosylceramidase